MLAEAVRKLDKPALALCLRTFPLFFLLGSCMPDYYMYYNNKIVSELEGEKGNLCDSRDSKKGKFSNFVKMGRSRVKREIVIFLMLTYGPSLCMHDL